MVPEDAPDGWRIPYLNAVAAMDWAGSPQELLQSLQHIETGLGRAAALRWAPRIIDLDLLVFGDQTIGDPHLVVPHAGIWGRSFVLDPLKHLAPGLRLPGHAETVLKRARELPGHAPLWMGILNLTPDSFSDGGELADEAELRQRIAAWDSAGVQIFDLGGESTRPGARHIAPDEEWSRLEPALHLLRDRYAGRLFRPWISVDTRHAATAARALAMGADIINDVGGLSDPAMGKILQGGSCQYVLMHSLSIPADKNQVLDENRDPVEAVRVWALEKLESLSRLGIGLDRIIFDPGIGFGKTPSQSLALLQGIESFLDLPVRILAGHSRKSFMILWNNLKAEQRDPESIGLSLRLADKGVDILRVHEPQLHIRAFRAFQEAAGA